MERMVELLRRNEGERTRIQSFAVWSLDETPNQVPDMQGVQWIGSVRDIHEAVQIHNLDEVVFSGRDVRADAIVDVLPLLGKKNVKCRIAWTDAGDVMSSGGASRESFVAFGNGLHLPEVARTKRSFDVLSACFVLMLSPFCWVTGRKGWAGAAWRVLTNKATWVSPGNFKSTTPPILQLTHGMTGRAAERKAFTHGQDYHWRKDLSVVVDALISRRAIFSHGHH